jgi:hypothetical protein
MSKPTGLSTEGNLLYEILKQLDQINKVLGAGTAPVIITTTTTTTV